MRRTILGAALIASAWLGACTGDGTVAGPEATVTLVPSPSVENPVPSPTQVFDDDDDVLEVAVGDVSTLDPMRIQDPGSVLIARQLYEGLTRWDPIEEKVLPAAAESWDARSGGRTWIFHLRAGMTFHDGSPVTASDFRFALDRIATKSNASDLAYTLERISGFEAVNRQGSRDRLAGISAPDDLTLVVDLDQPFYDFPALMTHPGLVPVPKHAVDAGDSFVTFPIGNGPFQMAVPWSAGRDVTLRAFPGFIETPELDGIRFTSYPDAAASWLRFLDGELDVVEVPAGQIEVAEEAFGSKGFKPFLAGYYYGLNLKADQLKSRRLREAINRAIDRPTIARSIYKGTLEPARGIVPVGMPGFIENMCVDLCEYDPDEARSLVQRLPVKQRSIRLQYTQGDPHGKVARAIARDLEAAGLKVKVKGYGFSSFLKLLQSGKQDVYRLGWIGEYPVPAAFLQSLFESGSPDNHSGFASTKVDRLLAEARSEPSEGRRIQLYLQAERAILKQAPIVPIGSFVTHWAAQPKVEGIAFDAMGGFDAVEVGFASE